MFITMQKCKILFNYFLPQTYVCAAMCGRFPKRVCALTEKFSSAHLYCAACAHNRFLLLSPVNDERGEQLAVTPVPRTSSGPMRQLKLDVCALSASSNSYKGLQLSECYQLTFTLNSGLILSLLGNWQADQFTCIICTLTLERGNSVTARILIKFLWCIMYHQATIQLSEHQDRLGLL